MEDLSDRAALFADGKDDRCYEWLGAHRLGESYVFRVRAPRAERAFLVGDLNGWSEGDEMSRVGDTGVWEAVVPKERVSVGDKYKFMLERKGKRLFRSDPFCSRMESPPYGASIICDADGYPWHDGGWMAYRESAAIAGARRLPLNVYATDLSHWKLRADGSERSCGEIAEELAPYLKQMGYTHVELLPIAEHHGESFDPCGLYAPAARLGEPYDIMRFVDVMHGAGLGVIFGAVVDRFSPEEYSLANYDGEALYETGEALELGKTRRVYRFDVSSPPTRSFIVSSVCFWADKYHADGIRLDGEVLSSDSDGVAAELFASVNAALKEHFPSVISISTCPTGQESERKCGNVCPTERTRERTGEDKPGQTDLVWDSDTLSALWTRLLRAEKLGDALDASAILSPKKGEEPDRSVYYRGTSEYPDGTEDEARLRLFEILRMTLPGKKRTLTGQELALTADECEDGRTVRALSAGEGSESYQRFCSELNCLYLRHSELWQRDCDCDAQRLDPIGKDVSGILAYVRKNDARGGLLTVLNFTDRARDCIEIALNEPSECVAVFSSDGGTGASSLPRMRTREESGGYVINISLPPYKALVFEVSRIADPSL